MRFKSLTISNLRAVRSFEVSDLSDFIMIAGQNGSGKSCVFDAIRLLKSIYGGYSQDEHMQWFTEFAINPQDSHAMRAMFRDPSKPVSIAATIEYSAEELTFLRQNANDLIWPIAWQRTTGQRMDYWTFNRMAIATQLGYFGPAVESQVQIIKKELFQALDSGSTFELAVEVPPDGNIELAPCIPAEVAFQAYEPLNLGIIEYHSASRAYNRQPLQGINLDARAFEDQRRQQSLYNAQAKYQNVKTELAAGYLRNLIAAESDLELEGEDLNDTLKELFSTFFPDKRYLGVRPLAGGSLEFPVELPGGEIHDIDELSSGEKEILYGYLRLRNSTPRGSVILLDEPELHLNPSLLQGFTDFYHRHLGLAQGNQLWLVTHSDALLRQAIGNSNYRVYHMLSGSSGAANQASPVLLDNDLERVVVDLVGDLAAYRPHAKVVILEGDYEDGFDASLIKRLFPDFAKRVNLVSAGSKQRVRNLYSVLNSTATEAGIRNRFFAIVDKDHDVYSEPDPGATEFAWDVYHIENFLLDAPAVRAACLSLTGSDQFESDDDVESALRAHAETIVDRLVTERVRDTVNRAIVGSINIGGSPDSSAPGVVLKPSIDNSVQRVIDAGKQFTEAHLAELADTAREGYGSAFADGTWQKTIPGRRILTAFAGEYVPKAGYEPLRNAILDKLVLAKARPANIEETLKRILDA